MKKYNVPNVEFLSFNCADVISSSAFTVLASGSGANWYWNASPVSNEDGMDI